VGRSFFFVLSQFTRLTDGWKDGQADGPLIAIPRLHSWSAVKWIANQAWTVAN